VRRMFQTTQKTVDEIVAVVAGLAKLLVNIRILVVNLRKHAAVAKRGDVEVVERKKTVLEVLTSMKKVTEGAQTSAMRLYRSGVFPPATALIQLLGGQQRHLQKLVSYIQVYDSTSPVYEINTGTSQRIETELTELEKLYEETLVFLKGKEEGKERAAA